MFVRPFFPYLEDFKVFNIKFKTSGTILRISDDHFKITGQENENILDDVYEIEFKNVQLIFYGFGIATCFSLLIMIFEIIKHYTQRAVRETKRR